MAAAERAARAARAAAYTARNANQLPGEIVLSLARATAGRPLAARFALAGVQGTIRFRGWQENTIAADALFEPPEGRTRVEADAADLRRVFAATLEFALSRFDRPENTVDWSKPGAASLVVSAIRPVTACYAAARASAWWSFPACRSRWGPPGALLATGETDCRRCSTSSASAKAAAGWFLDRMAEIDRRTRPHVPPCSCRVHALAGRPAFNAQRPAGQAVPGTVPLQRRGPAAGHRRWPRAARPRARLYRDIGLQDVRAATVPRPRGTTLWMSLGYAGFIGTVTAMNEKGLAIGEMGGRGEGQWDGIPMSS